MADLDVRTLTADDLRAAFAVFAQSFNRPLDTWGDFERRVRPDRMHGAFEGGRLVGSLIVHELGQWFGGHPVAMGGIGAVTVTPDRRGTGVGRALLLEALRAMRERGEVLSALYPATVPPYRRTGWEVAGARVERRVPIRSLATLPGPSATAVRLARPDELDLVADVYARVGRDIPGFVIRNDVWWERTRHQLEDREHRYLYLAERDGAVTGYAIYSHADATGEDEFFHVAVNELIAGDRDALLALLRLVASYRSLTERVSLFGGLDEPLYLLLDEQDIELREDWRWMLRIVDVPGALSDRGYPRGLSAEVDLEVRDATAPWNAARWRLEVRDGTATVEPGGDGTVALDVTALAPLYTGLVGASELARTGFLTSADADAVAVLDATFAGPSPWMADFF